jgi:hypothetical protein
MNHISALGDFFLRLPAMDAVFADNRSIML